MPAALTALAVGQGIKSVYQFGKGKGWWGAQPPKRKQSGEERLYGEELRRRTKEGTLSPAVQMMIRNQALQGAYGMAQRGASDISARLSGQGFEGSALIGEAAQPLYSQAISKAGDVAGGVALQNELSKTQAFGQLAEYGAGESARKYQNALAKYGAKSQAYDQAIGGFADIAGGVAGHFASKLGQFDLSKFQTGGGDQAYTVKSGDTLGGIAKQFGGSWQDIYGQNKSVIGGDPNMLQAGMNLNLQGGQGGYDTEEIWNWMMNNPEEAKRLLPILFKRGVLGG